MKPKFWFLLIISILTLAIVSQLLAPAGVFKTIHPHFKGKFLNTYTNVTGPEDLDIDYENNLLFISASGRSSEKTSDGIYVLNLNEPNAIPTLLKSNLNDTFKPHGISLFTKDSTLYLYVVNHIQDDDFIELFEYKKDSLILISRFSDALIVSPNDIVGLSTDEFYITNDHSSDHSRQDMIEDYLRLKNRNIIHFKQGKYSIAAEGLAMPNGINTNSSNSLLYCATTLGQKLVTYARDQTSGKLEEISRTALNSGLDNIDVDIDGNLWIGSHPKLFDFVSHAKDQSNLSPSQVLKLTPQASDGQFKVVEVFLDDGQLISGSSVAAVYGRDLFIGVVFQNKILRARMNPQGHVIN